MNKTPPHPDQNTLSAENAPRLGKLDRKPDEKRIYNKRYTAFIRYMRIVLPLIALSIIAVLFSWNTLQPDKLMPAQPDPETKATIGKNELLNPRFDSIDDKNQPYTITAKRALQGANEELILLEEPMADIMLENGNWVAIKAIQGAFRQESQRLLLKKNVTLFHDEGYTFKTQELDVDMKAGTAQTYLAINGHGPLGILNASGMNASTEDNKLTFKGPAKLILHDTNTTKKDILNP